MTISGGMGYSVKPDGPGASWAWWGTVGLAMRLNGPMPSRAGYSPLSARRNDIDKLQVSSALRTVRRAIQHCGRMAHRRLVRAFGVRFRGGGCPYSRVRE